MKKKCLVYISQLSKMLLLNVRYGPGYSQMHWNVEQFCLLSLTTFKTIWNVLTITFRPI